MSDQIKKITGFVTQQLKNLNEEKKAELFKKLMIEEDSDLAKALTDGNISKNDKMFLGGHILENSEQIVMDDIEKMIEDAASAQTKTSTAETVSQPAATETQATTETPVTTGKSAAGSSSTPHELWKGFGPVFGPKQVEQPAATKTPVVTEPPKATIGPMSPENKKFWDILKQYEGVSLAQFRSQFKGEKLEEFDRITNKAASSVFSNEKFTLEDYTDKLFDQNKISQYNTFKKFIAENVILPQDEVGKLRASFTDRIMSGEHNDGIVLEKIKLLDNETFIKVFADPEFLEKFNVALFNKDDSNNIINYMKTKMSTLAGYPWNVNSSRHSEEDTLLQLQGWARAIQKKDAEAKKQSAEAKPEAKAKQAAEAAPTEAKKAEAKKLGVALNGQENAEEIDHLIRIRKELDAEAKKAEAEKLGVALTGKENAEEIDNLIRIRKELNAEAKKAEAEKLGIALTGKENAEEIDNLIHIRKELDAEVLTNIKTLQGGINENLAYVKESKETTDNQKADATNISGAIDADVKKAEEAKTSAEAQKIVNDAESKLKKLEIILNKAKVEPPFVESELKKAQDEVGKINDFTPKNADATQLAEQVNNDISTVGKLVDDIKGNVADIQKLVNKAKVAVENAKTAVENKEKAEKQAKAEEKARAKAEKARAKAEEKAKAEKQAKIDAWTEEKLKPEEKLIYSYGMIKNLPITKLKLEKLNELNNLKAEVSKYLPETQPKEEGMLDKVAGFFVTPEEVEDPNSVDLLSMKKLDNFIKRNEEESLKNQKTIDDCAGDYSRHFDKSMAETMKEKNDAAIKAFKALKGFIVDNYKPTELMDNNRPLSVNYEAPERFNEAELSDKDKQINTDLLKNVKVALEKENDPLLKSGFDFSKIEMKDLNDLLAKYKDNKDVALKLEAYKNFMVGKILEQSESCLDEIGDVAVAAWNLSYGSLAGALKFVSGDYYARVKAADKRTCEGSLMKLSKTENLTSDGKEKSTTRRVFEFAGTYPVLLTVNTAVSVAEGGSSVIDKGRQVLDTITNTNEAHKGLDAESLKTYNTPVKLASVMASCVGAAVDGVAYLISGEYILNQNETITRIAKLAIDDLKKMAEAKNEGTVYESQFLTDLSARIGYSPEQIANMSEKEVWEKINDSAHKVIDDELLLKNASALAIQCAKDSTGKLLLVDEKIALVKLEDAWNKFKELGGDLTALPKDVGSKLGDIWTSLTDLNFSKVGENVNDLAITLKDAPVTFTQNVVGSTLRVVPYAGDVAAAVTDTAFNSVKDLSTSVTSVFTGQFSKAGNSFMNGVTGGWWGEGGVKGALNDAVKYQNKANEAYLEALKSISDQDDLADAIEDAEDAAKEAAEAAKEAEDELKELEDEKEKQQAQQFVAQAKMAAENALSKANEARKLMQLPPIAITIDNDGDAETVDANKLKTLDMNNIALTISAKDNRIIHADATLTSDMSVKKVQNMNDLRAKAIDKTDYNKPFEKVFAESENTLAEAILGKEDITNITKDIINDEVKRLEGIKKKIQDNQTFSPKHKANLEYRILANKAANATGDAQSKLINDMVDLYMKNYPSADKETVLAKAQQHVKAIQDKAKKTVTAPIVDVLKRGMNKFEANRLFEDAKIKALFKDQKEMQKALFEILLLPSNKLSPQQRTLRDNFMDIAGAFIRGSLTCLLRDSSTIAHQLAAVVPFISPLEALFLMGLGAEDHIKGVVNILKGKYVPAQKATGWKEQGLAAFKDIIILFHRHHGDYAKKISDPCGCKPKDPMLWDPEFSDPMLGDPSKVPFI